MVHKYFHGWRNPLKGAPRITHYYINLIPDSGILVHVTVRSLSSTMASVMAYYVRNELSDTSNYCDMTDQFFDCMNARSVHENIRK